MKFLVFALLGYLGVVAHAFCGNDEPTVLGFGEDDTVFDFPPKKDPVCDGLLTNCITYNTNSAISFDTYDAGGEVTETLTPAEYYSDSDDLTTFVQLCEELWILTDYIAQSAATQGNYDYTSLGLCFDGNSTNGYFFEPDLNSARANFIINTCHGSEGSADERLELLADSVETTLALAEDRARQETFDTTTLENLAADLKEAEDLYEEPDFGDICVSDSCSETAAVCLELRECYKNQFGSGGLLQDFASLFPPDVAGPSVDEIVSDSFVYLQCFNVSFSNLTATKTGICAEIPDQGCSPYSIDDGAGGCRSNPVCPLEGYFDSFAPDYPNPETQSSYALAVASIEDLYLCSADDLIDYTDRTSADAVGITLIVKIALESLQIALEVFKDSLPHWEIYIFKILPFIANAIAIGVVDTILEQTALHDGLVDGAEMEAIYENSLQLLNGSASIYDEVVCRCVNPDEPRRGQGCDSIDNDCDKTVDECDEDRFKPEIDISAASLNCASGNGQTKWFTDEADALSCVSTYSAVVDDCDTGIVFDEPVVLAGTCDSATITLNAKDRCENDAVEAIVPVFLDEVAPMVKCSFGDDPGINIFDDGDDPDNKILYVDDTGAGIMTNVNLNYAASDNCKFDMDVQVDVFANEIEDVHNQATAIFFRNGMSNNRAGLYVAAQFCVTDANGQCVKDPKLPETRVYTIVVSASDEAGNAAVPAVCRVVIVPEGKVAARLAGKGKPLDIGVSTQRFHLTSYSSTFTFSSSSGEEILYTE